MFTHISVQLPGSTGFLINPYGMLFEEITASSLVKIDSSGNKLEDSPWPVNPAGFVIHSAVHAARKDAVCVLHTHTPAAVAVSANEKACYRFPNRPRSPWPRSATTITKV